MKNDNKQTIFMLILLYIIFLRSLIDEDKYYKLIKDDTLKERLYFETYKNGDSSYFYWHEFYFNSVSEKLMSNQQIKEWSWLQI